MEFIFETALSVVFECAGDLVFDTLCEWVGGLFQKSQSVRGQLGRF